MTLDEAILHAREVAVRNRKQYKSCPSDRTDIRHQTCEECAEEHEQLAEWLEELKSYRTSVFSGDMTQIMLKEEYCKAVDDFVKEFKRKTPMENCLIDEIVEQLKAGEQNE